MKRHKRKRTLNTKHTSILVDLCRHIWTTPVWTVGAAGSSRCWGDGQLLITNSRRDGAQSGGSSRNLPAKHHRPPSQPTAKFNCSNHASVFRGQSLVHFNTSYAKLKYRNIKLDQNPSTLLYTQINVCFEVCRPPCWHLRYHKGTSHNPHTSFYIKPSLLDLLFLEHHCFLNCYSHSVLLYPVNIITHQWNMS